VARGTALPAFDVARPRRVAPTERDRLKVRAERNAWAGKAGGVATAGLIANLDLVISVDTGVVHLAGALGKPVWVLLRFIPDWRWLLDRDDSP
jgi:ADP-heptose:LPS heptosyltransferase